MSNRVNDVGEAKKLAIQSAYDRCPLPIPDGFEFAVFDDQIIETRYGWAFLYTTKSYLASDRNRPNVFGAVGCVVERIDGSVHPLPGIFSLRTWLRIYELKKRPSLRRWLIAQIYLLYECIITGQAWRFYLANPVSWARFKEIRAGGLADDE